MIYGHVVLFFILCYVDFLHLMGKIKNKLCKRLIYNLFNLTVNLLIIFLDSVWSKRSSKAKQLIMKMLAKKPEDRITAE